MIRWTKKLINNIWGRLSSPFFNLVTPEQRQQIENAAEKSFLHQLNGQAHSLNKDLVQKSATMQDIPLSKHIYSDHRPQQPQPVPQQVVQPVPQQVPQQVVQPVQQDLSPLIDRITAVEKQVTKFVNLIERNVAKNAKEINIRIKLNENNDSTDSK